MTAGNVVPTKSELNTARICSVSDALAAEMRAPEMNTARVYDLCLSLSRGIDYSVAHNEPSALPAGLPALLKQVFQIKRDPQTLAAVMVLMISVKNALHKGWFSDGDSKELMAIAEQTANEFGTHGFNVEPCISDSVISTLMSRFYPTLKIQHIYVFLEVKPGFDAYLMDFLLEKDERNVPKNINLFVAQKDMETSACLITPPLVNFLLNGQGLPNRTPNCMDSGPQRPTLLNRLLRFGSNLLQAVGEFNGNFIIIVAHTSESSYPSSTDLKDYEQLAPATVDAGLDSEVIEGQSQVSINCPISFQRIKNPVKGHLCKHFACFDYENFVEINSRRPSWRCPHCNQSVCFTDIRLDQKMVEILKGVGPTVFEVIISSDGSWSVVATSDEGLQKPEEIPESVNVESSQPMDVIDLDDIDEAPTFINPSTSEDRNCAQTSSQDRAGGAFWSTIYQSTLSRAMASLPHSPADHNPHASVVDTNPVIYPALDPWMGNLQANATQVSNVASCSVPMNPYPSSSCSQLSQVASPTMMDARGRFSSFPHNVTGTSPVVQALLAQHPVYNSQHWSMAQPSVIQPNAIPVTSQAAVSNPPVPPNINSWRTSQPLYSGSLAMPPHMMRSSPNVGIHPASRPAPENQWSSTPTQPQTANLAPQTSLNSRAHPVADQSINNAPRSNTTNPNDMNLRPGGLLVSAGVQSHVQMRNHYIYLSQMQQMQLQQMQLRASAPQPSVADRGTSTRTSASAGVYYSTAPPS